jgi:hypothetical protein
MHIETYKPPESFLQDVIKELSGHVLKSASVADSDFFSHFDGLFGRPKNATFYRHGQHKGSQTNGTYGSSEDNDDHHSPLTPEQYLKLRVKIQIELYQSRLPLYERTRMSFEVLLIMASMSGSVLAFLRVSSYVTIPVALTTAVTAYSKFSSPDKKMQRYSDAISGLDNVLLQWRALTDVEKANTEFISELIDSCESTFAAERQAWVSTSMANSRRLTSMREHERMDHQRQKTD